ncbi:MAG: histone deacetylase [Polyangiaceae bacterium]
MTHPHQASTPFLVDDPLFGKHAPKALHPERPERLEAARAGVRTSGVDFRTLPARAATTDEIVRVHDPRFVERLEALRGRESQLDADTYVSERSVEAALVAAGGTLALIEALHEGNTQGVALVRPPGHHARRDQAMGFCLLNNVAIAAAHARARGLTRILVVDWDVHHGNGTQEMFWDDPHVLYVSTHQFPFYPGTGAARERGDGDGKGYTLNAPLGAGGGDGIYRSVFERVVLPVADEYKPELVIVSAGFDAAARDPLAQMELSTDAFAWMAGALRDVADRHAGGRMALVLEGGYDLVALEEGMRAAVRGMMRLDAPTLARDPDAPDVARAHKATARYWPVLGPVYAPSVG